MKFSFPDLRDPLSRFLLIAAASAGLTAPTAAQATALGTNGAAVPNLAWAPCEDESLLERDPDFECATALVPVDYNAPGGAKLDVAVSRLAATGPGATLGSVFVNPGGPGAGGRDAATFATAALRERFDIIGFDPRGTGASKPVRCAATNEERDRLLAAPFPLNGLQELTALTLATQGAAACGRNGGPLLSHMSTGNVARDLDLMRRAVGDPKLNFLGFSYGSVIGSTYVNLFPTKSRALVLDGVVDPVRFLTGRTALETTQPIDFRAKSYEGTDEAVGAFLAACAANPATCAFAEPGSTSASLRTKFDDTLARVRAKNGVEVDFGDGELITLSYQDLVAMVYGELNVGIFTSQDLAAALEAVSLASVGSSAIPRHDLEALLDALRRSHTAGQGGPAEPGYDNFVDAFYGVVCSDANSPRGGLQWPFFGRTADAQVSGFGAYWVWTTAPCATWPVGDRDRYQGPWNAPTTNPVLLVGNRLGDPSTRYAGAVATRSTLGNARLLSVDVYGHTAYGLTGSCVDEAVDAYFISLTAPANGTVCEPDFGPFDPISEFASDEGAEVGYQRRR